MRQRVALGVSILLGLPVFLVGQTAGSKTNAVRCGNLFATRGDSLRKNVVIVIEGEKIKELANAEAALMVPHGVQVVDGSDNACQAVREQISYGADWIKVYSDRSYRVRDVAVLDDIPTFTLES